MAHLEAAGANRHASERAYAWVAAALTQSVLRRLDGFPCTQLVEAGRGGQHLAGPGVAGLGALGGHLVNECSVDSRRSCRRHLTP